MRKISKKLKKQLQIDKTNDTFVQVLTTEQAALGIGENELRLVDWHASQPKELA